MVDAWPDAIDAVLAGVRSGDSLPAALATAAASGPEALRPALDAAVRRATATGDFSGALTALADGLGDPVSRQVCAMLALAHDVGGREIAQVLRDLAAFVREERSVRQELLARQAWTVTAARVAAAGPWAVLFLLSMDGAARTSFVGPTGTAVLLIGAALTVVGYRLMLLLGRLPATGAGG